tara:strand:+ start:119 stop:349 length:231 start_codon:yes stop_codon:yes gene_type:complete
MAYPQSAIAAEQLQLQPDILQSQPSISNCSRVSCIAAPIGCNCRHADFFSCLFFEYNLQLGGRAARWIRKPAIAAE